MQMHPLSIMIVNKFIVNRLEMVQVHGCHAYCIAVRIDIRLTLNIDT